MGTGIVTIKAMRKIKDESKNNVSEPKKSDNKETVKAALSNTIANVIVMAFALLMLPITTRILSTEDLGIATNFFSIRNICLNIYLLYNNCKLLKAQYHKGELSLYE